MNSYGWPNEVDGGNEQAVAWLNSILHAAKMSAIKDIVFVGGGTGKVVPAADGTTLILSVPQQGAVASTPMFPFKIYNPPGAASNVYQVRGGLVGFRGNYLLPSMTIAQTRKLYQGNYELPLIAGGTDIQKTPYLYAQSGGIDFEADPTLNTGATVNLNATDTNFLVASNSPVATVPAGGTITITPNIGITQVSFWVKIIDHSTNGPYCELWANTAATVVQFPFGRGYSPPSGNTTFVYQEQTFAVGFILCATDGSANIISQAQTGHLLNRYLEVMPRPSNESDDTTSSPKFKGIGQVNRGAWTANALSGKIFYPGDIVVDDRTFVSLSLSPSGILTANKSYIYFGQSAQGYGMNIETMLGGSPVWVGGPIFVDT